MTFQVITNLTNYDTVLSTIKSFIDAVNTAVGGGGAWGISTSLTAATVDTAGASAAGGHVLIVYGKGANNQDVTFGMRSTVTGPGANCLYMFDGIGTGSAPASGIEHTIPGNSGGDYGAYTNAGVIVAGGKPQIRGFQNPFVGPYPSMWCFSNATGDYLHFVLEIAAGKFRHLHIGAITKFATWPFAGGGYYAGSFWSQSGLGSPPGNNISIPSSNNHILPWDNNSSFVNSCEWTVHYQSPNGASTGNWISPAGDYATNITAIERRNGRGSIRGGWGRMFKNISESLYSGLIPIGPVVIGAVRQSDTPDSIRFIGQIPDVRMVNMTNLTDGQTFAIGTDIWQCFSFASKNGSPGQENSGVGGFAYKQIT